MSSVAAPVRSPHWYYVPLRALIITFFTTLLAFAVSLLLGILGTSLAGFVRGVHPNMAFAYRRIAFPAAVVAAALVLVWSLALEIRQYRHERMLRRMEEQLRPAS